MITNQGVQLGGREIGLPVVGRVGGRRPLRPTHSVPQVELFASPRVVILASVTYTHGPGLVQIAGLLFSGWTEATRADVHRPVLERVPKPVVGRVVRFLPVLSAIHA